MTAIVARRYCHFFQYPRRYRPVFDQDETIELVKRSGALGGVCYLDNDQNNQYRPRPGILHGPAACQPGCLLYGNPQFG